MRTDLAEAFEALRPDLQAFGDFIEAEIVNEFGGRKNRADAVFLTVEPSVRVKDLESFMEKALYRGKEYANPIEEITDKVGVRVVVLLQECVNEVCKFIAGASRSWASRQDQDYIQQRERKPEQFLYESQHFIVWPRDGSCIPEVEASPALTAEIQVRTLLQHAYSELSHGTTYKGALAQDRAVRRLLARSMALIETTDGIFGCVTAKIRDVEAPMTELLIQLSSQYRTWITGAPAPNIRMNQYIIDYLQPVIAEIEDIPAAVRLFIGSDGTWLDVINKWSERDLLFRQPAVLLLMYLAKHYPVQLKTHWPLRDEQYDYLLSSMNISASA